MKRFWELIINARGGDRFYCFPFLFLFRLITPVYQAISRRHLRNRKRNRSRDWKAKVISIGSVTIGGSGKTPLVIALTRRFIDSGKKVAVVHSGYGRNIKESVYVDYGETEKYDVRQLGDEVTVIANELPRAAFAVGRDKKEMVREADRRFSPDLIIIDDGFQRLDIEKDMDIAVIDTSAISGGLKPRLFPGGILRESFTALARADALFVFGYIGDGRETCLPVNIPSNIDRGKIYSWGFAFGKPTLGGQQLELSQLADKKPFLFAGIGSFDRLLEMTSEAGISPVGHYRFGDHYDYDKLDIDHLMGLATGAKADCYLTTAKDMVKLAHLKFDRPLYCLHLKISPFDESGIGKLLDLEAE